MSCVYWQLRAMAPIDLLIGGSPCNDFSIANPSRQGLEGELTFLLFSVITSG